MTSASTTQVRPLMSRLRQARNLVMSGGYPSTCEMFWPLFLLRRLRRLAKTSSVGVLK